MVDAEPQPSPERAVSKTAVPPGTAKISALITTFNEERHIGACIESLLWCDEVLVVDSFSTDRTPEISRGYDRVRFVQRTYHGSASQKNWAIDQTKNEWILIFDADERCTPALRDEILALFARGEPEHETYTIDRRCFFLGKPIRFSGWQHDRVVRLLRRGAGRYPNRRVHADMVTRGEAPVLRNYMLHYMVDDFVEYASRIQRYSWWGAAQSWRDGKRSGPAEVFGRSVWRFLRTYLLQGGIFDGMRGLVFCLIQAYGTYLKWSYVWAWRVNAERGIDPKLPSFDESDDTWRGLDQPESASSGTAV
jgi:glycosyltransferase involved in cell wall biosynthesis